MSKKRVRFTSQVMDQVWIRWREGESLGQIARSLGSRHTSLSNALSRVGGIQPAKRHRAAHHLTLSEREEISRGICIGESIRAIASRIGRAPSTVCRELNRNQGADYYRAVQADDAAWKRGLRPKPCKLANLPELCQLIAGYLKENWSPEQIAGRIKKMHPDNPELHISHETIYRSLFIQSRGVLKKELTKFLKSGRIYRRPKSHTMKGQGLGKIVDAVSISERPAEVDDRAVPGHWEGDLVMGGRDTQVATLVERSSRFLMLVKVDGRDTQTVINALIKHAQKLPSEVYKSLTWDRGAELSDHKRFSLATNIQVYFCDPQSPWQRGSNENTNRLLREYFPKGTNFSLISQEELDYYANKLNTRPRKTLDYATPAEVFNESVALTG